MDVKEQENAQFGGKGGPSGWGYFPRSVTLILGKENEPPSVKTASFEKSDLPVSEPNLAEDERMHRKKTQLVVK